MKLFELVVPAYNEEKNLKLLIDRAILAATEAGLQPEDFSLVIVNNGSQDRSADFLKKYSDESQGKWFRIVTVEKNQGYGFGLWQGLQSTSAKYIGWSHADLQCDPSDAMRALKILKNTTNTKLFVKGARQGRDWKDKIVSRCFELLAWLILNLRVHEMNAQPKVFPASLLQLIKNPPKTFAFDLYFLYCAAKNGYSYQTISVRFPARIHGVSHWASHFLSRYKTMLGILKYMYSLKKHEGRIPWCF